MPAERMLPTPEAESILGLARDFAARELAPNVAAAEAGHHFPREVFTALGELGLLAMPFEERWGGGGLSYEVYLQALEEIGGAWASVGVGMSVHGLACLAVARHGSPEQQERFLPELLGGRLLGAYCLSEPDAGSDPGAMRTRATRTNDATRATGSDGAYRIRGTKAWVTHGGEADFYTVFARTSDDRRRGISCFLVPADADGLHPQTPERKMGLTASTTASIVFDDVEVEAERRIGEEGAGLAIALGALDSGRLGIAAVAVGLAQACLDHAVEYAGQRQTFGRTIIEHQGVAFLLADMAAAVESSRAVMLEAARRRDRGLPFSRQASISKLLGTDTAMRVSTDAVQVLGGAGYTQDFPVERMMREAKAMQIFEGTNQIQRLVIARQLMRG